MDEIERRIYNEIRKNLRIRWSDLRRIIVDEKQLISERPFREILNDLVERKLVFKDEVEKGHTEYYVDKDFENIEKDFRSALKKQIPEFRKTIKHIKKFRDKIPKDVLAGHFTLLWKLSNHLDFKVMIVSLLTKNSKIADIDELQKIKMDLIDLISKSNLEYTLDLFKISDDYLQYETEEMKKLFQEDWKSRSLPMPNDDKTNP